MLRPSRVNCSVLPRKAIVGLFASFATIALLPCGIALADTVTTDFEAPAFSTTAGVPPGSINGQGMVDGRPGWKSGEPGQASCPPYSAYDQAVVSHSQFPAGALPGWGQQSWRFSNLFGCGEFTYQTYSTPLQDPAGENDTNKVFTAQFSFIPTTPNPQPGLYVSVSPDDYAGGRMLRVDLKSLGDRVLVVIADSPTGTDGDIIEHPVALLDPSKPHTIKLSMKFNAGPDNDIARVSIDGNDTGECFASWENFYRAWQPTMFPFGTNSLQFRAALGGFSTPNAGFLFDNVSYTSSNGPAPQGCDEQIDKQADSPTVTAGGLEGYRLTVRNRGPLSERDLLLCDHIPNHTTFVSSDRKLRRLGRRRCLLIPRLGPGHTASVHLMLRVNATAAAGHIGQRRRHHARTTARPARGAPGADGGPAAGPAAERRRRRRRDQADREG